MISKRWKGRSYLPPFLTWRAPGALQQKWWVAAGAPAKRPQSLTLGLVVMNHGRHAFFLVTDENRREIPRARQAEPAEKPSQYPAGIIKLEGRSVGVVPR